MTRSTSAIRGRDPVEDRRARALLSSRLRSNDGKKPVLARSTRRHRRSNEARARRPRCALSGDGHARRDRGHPARRRRHGERRGPSCGGPRRARVAAGSSREPRGAPRVPTAWYALPSSAPLPTARSRSTSIRSRCFVAWQHRCPRRGRTRCVTPGCSQVPARFAHASSRSRRSRLPLTRARRSRSVRGAATDRGRSCWAPSASMRSSARGAKVGCLSSRSCASRTTSAGS